MNDPRNPYSTTWSNKILEKRYNLNFSVGGFCNGVPIIKLVKKKKKDLPFVSKKINELFISSPGSSNDLEFNTNQKNFFKARKDIIEGKF